MKSAQVCERFGSEFSGCSCFSVCGICPSCVFAPKPAGAPTQGLWKPSDESRRKFLVGLLIRSRDVRELERIHRLLSVTSWTCFTYARARPPTAPWNPPQRAPSSRAHRVDVKKIWEWFEGSSYWMKSSYLCRIFSLCDFELLRLLFNLTSVLLVRLTRGSTQCHGCNYNLSDSEDPSFTVILGSSKSMSGVAKYRDFIGCLPVNLSKRILGLLDEHTLWQCRNVCKYWKHFAEETMEEIKLTRIFKSRNEAMMKCCRSINISPTYANVVDIPVPIQEHEDFDVHPALLKKPFKSAYAKIKTRFVQMEERNVYCGSHFTKVLLNKEDKHRVVDYRGGSFMATSSKHGSVHLLRVTPSETKAVLALRGHVSAIQAMLLCEERDLLISAGCDATIRGWNLKTNKCYMVLYGHSRTITCLDVQGDRLVSGAKDHTVRVWSLQTRSPFKEFNFRHTSPVQCVKVNNTSVYSSCDRGLVKMWSLQNASLLRVINAHKSSVKCLFLTEWHLLSGDRGGKVMAWSVSCVARKCLMTYSHPKEVRSLALIHLRVITGCLDGNIRIFSFLTGCCLREITTHPEAGFILSLHFLDHSILVNTSSSVWLYQFAKVFWDYTEPAYVDGAGDAAQPGSASRRFSGLTRKSSQLSSQRCPTASDSLKICSSNSPKSEERKVLQSVILSERATSERMKKRGPHHPMTGDAILLKVAANQRAQRMDEVSVNTARNAELRDSWGPHSDTQRLKSELQPARDGDYRRPKTCVPSEWARPRSRALHAAAGYTGGCPLSERAQPHGENTIINKSGYSKSPMVKFCYPNLCIRNSTSGTFQPFHAMMMDEVRSQATL